MSWVCLPSDRHVKFWSRYSSVHTYAKLETKMNNTNMLNIEQYLKLEKPMIWVNAQICLTKHGQTDLLGSLRH